MKRNLTYALAATLVALTAVIAPLAGASALREWRMGTPAGGIGPAEVHRIVTADGYTDATRPERRGDVYLVRATARDGFRVTLVVTAADGRLVGEGPVGSIRRPPAQDQTPSVEE